MNSGFEICKFQAKVHMSTCAVFALRSSIATLLISLCNGYFYTIRHTHTALYTYESIHLNTLTRKHTVMYSLC